MQLKTLDTFEHLTVEQYRRDYYLPGKPVIIKSIAKDWPAYHKWNWDFLKQVAGHHRVGIYNNIKSDAYTPINTADDYKTFGEIY